MKQPKRLTRDQKEIVSSHYLKADDWMLAEETEFYLKLINKRNGKPKTIDKFKRRKNDDSSRY